MNPKQSYTEREIIKACPDLEPLIKSLNTLTKKTSQEEEKLKTQIEEIFKDKTGLSLDIDIYLDIYENGDDAIFISRYYVKDMYELTDSAKEFLKVIKL